MKTYINEEGKISHFVGAIPDGFREMTEEEIQAEAATKAAKEAKRKNMEAIIEAQDEFLKGQFKGAIEHFRELYAKGEMQKAENFLKSPHIPAGLKPIVDAILVEFEKDV
jgi:regulator of protease activity HflC (stomatin/prohibitin superfamily)